jgi:CRISPR-associated endonuclease Cas1
LHVHGWAGVTSPALAALFALGIPVIWRGATGYPIGLSMPLHSAGTLARRAQYLTSGTSRGLDIAKALVAAKIVNMKGVARRKASLRGREQLDALGIFARKARHARDLNELMGIEGAATARYFSIWPDLISDRAGDLEFTGRSKRPPRDMINAMLSYAYAVLAGECLCAAASAGLDPRIGFLHRPRAGRPALALDLIEPFRPLIADQAVLAGLNTGQIKPHLFTQPEDEDAGVRFTDDGRRLILSLIEKRLASAVSLPDRSEPIAYRGAISLQARALARALDDNQPFAAMERP